MGLIYAFLSLVVCCMFVNHAHAAECTPQEFSACLAPMASLATLGELNMETMNMDTVTQACGMLKTGAACFEGLTCDLPAQFQQEMSKFKAMESMCAGAAGGDQGCSLVDLQKCSTIAQSIAKEKDEKNIALMCSKMAEIKKCFTDMQPHCTGEMKNQIDTALSQFTKQSEEMEVMCAGINAAGGKSCNAGACLVSLAQLAGNESEPSLHCRIATEAVACLETEKPMCNANQLNTVDTYLKELTPYTSKDCCPVMVELNNECIKGNDDLLNVTTFKAKDDNCLKLETLFTCSQKYNPKCPEIMMKAASEGKAVVKKNLESCDTGGYKVSVNYKGNGNDVVLPSIAVMLIASLFTFGF